MTGFPPNPVILVTPVITADGCDDWGDENPEEQRQPHLGHVHNKMVRRSSSLSEWRGRVNGAEASGFDADGINRKTILFFTGFPSKLENDGAGRPRPPEGAGTPRRQDQRRRESSPLSSPLLDDWACTTFAPNHESQAGTPENLDYRLTCSIFGCKLLTDCIGIAVNN